MTRTTPLFGRFAAALFAGTAGVAAGQTAASNNAEASAPPNQDEILRMSAFEVRTTQGVGYVASNSATGFKTDQSLLEIPQGLIVVTQDLIKDIDSGRSSDILNYTGATDLFRGESVMIRGTRIGNPYLDDVPVASTNSDNAYIDSYEIVKGPAAVFYQSASLGGVILMGSKKPLPVQQIIADATVSEWGNYRFVFDATSPILNKNNGDFTLGYRFIASNVGGNYYLANRREDFRGWHPVIEMHYKNSELLVAYDYIHIYINGESASILEPNGGLYTGAGRRDGGFIPNGANPNNKNFFRTTFIQKISQNWQMQMHAQMEHDFSYGISTLPLSINWGTNIENYEFSFATGPTDWWTIIDDFKGDYKIGPLKNQSIFGFMVIDQVSKSYSDVAGTFTVPIGPNNQAALNSIRPPTAAAGQALLPPYQGTRSNAYLDSIYYQHEIDLVPNWVSLVGGFTWSGIETVSDTNLAAGPTFPSTDTYGTNWLHRFGVVAHATKDIVVYGLESTSFNLGTGVNYQNVPNPNVQEKSDEVGIKTAILDGRISTTISVFRMALTNQDVLSGGTNIAGVLYYNNIGSTTTRGWDADAAVVLFPGWQLLVTGYVGTVRSQLNLPISQSYLNSLSVYSRYDFPDTSFLKGLTFGGGLNRIGGRYITAGAETLPAGYLPPAYGLIKLKEGNLVQAFIDYRFLKHWTVGLRCDNLLDETFPIGVQGVVGTDPSPPQTFSGYFEFKW